jgi:DHA1 family bicyclomycin/chloramphenicol resistance-like MFS transporter
VGFRVLQGLSSGAGIVVSRAVIRDMFPAAESQRVMSQVTIYFGVAPAVAPMVGGFLFVHAGWHSIFWLLTAVGVVLWVANYRLLPETLHVSQRQSFDLRNLLRGYREMIASPRFMMLVLASGVPFNGMFLYVLAAPTFLGQDLQLAPSEFFWLFLITIAGIMAGAWTSGRLAGRIKPHHQIRHGLLIMLLVSLANVALNLLFTPNVWWALWPLGIYAFGWALMVPVVTLKVLDLMPLRRGMASSLQACVGSAANGVVAGAVAPLVMHSTVALAVASMCMMGIGLGAWIWVKPRLQ